MYSNFHFSRAILFVWIASLLINWLKETSQQLYHHRYVHLQASRTELNMSIIANNYPTSACSSGTSQYYEMVIRREIYIAYLPMVHEKPKNSANLLCKMFEKLRYSKKDAKLPRELRIKNSVSLRSLPTHLPLFANKTSKFVWVRCSFLKGLISSTCTIRLLSDFRLAW